MIAATVVSPKYRKVAKEAIKRFKKFTGLVPIVIQAKDGDDAFFKKIRLDQLLPKKPTVFFDSDYWLLSHLDLSEMVGDCFYGVHDSAVFNPKAFPHTDCESFGMPKLDYINTGFFMCDLSNARHRGVFKSARKIKARVDSGKMDNPTDTTDQFYINMGRMQSGVGLSLLPNALNYYHYASVWGQQAWIPRNIIGLHGAGIPAEYKYETLVHQAKVFDHPFYPMHQEAMNWEMSRLVDLR
jgi:hypothetical protein